MWGNYKVKQLIKLLNYSFTVEIKELIKKTLANN